MRFVSAYPGRKVKKHFFPTNVNCQKTVTNSHPAVNIIETEDDFKIQLAAPGLTKKDFNLNVENETLTISAEKKVEKVEGETYNRHEFSFNEFKRTFHLPETIDNQQITANLENGILTVTLAKKEEAKPKPAKKIEIN